METKVTTETQNRETMPNNHMPLAIISTIVGCFGSFCIGLVLGGLGIYFATLVKPKWEEGDYDGARKAAKNAQTFSAIALAIGIILLIIQLVYRDQFLSNYQDYMNQLQNAN